MSRWLWLIGMPIVYLGADLALLAGAFTQGLPDGVRGLIGFVVGSHMVYAALQLRTGRRLVYGDAPDITRLRAMVAEANRSLDRMEGVTTKTLDGRRYLIPAIATALEELEGHRLTGDPAIYVTGAPRYPAEAEWLYDRAAVLVAQTVRAELGATSGATPDPAEPPDEHENG